MSTKRAADNAKERQEAASLLLKMKSFEFVVMLLVWEKVLTAIQIASADLQSLKMDLSKSAKDQWITIKMVAVKFALKVGVPVSFVN